MTPFLLLAAVRATVFIGLASYLTSSLVPAKARRLAFAGILSLLAAAFLDGATPDGWEYEYALGHPSVFYLFANAPVVLAVLAAYLIFGTWTQDNESN